jgi:hypothetical protein
MQTYIITNTPLTNKRKTRSAFLSAVILLQLLRQAIIYTMNNKEAGPDGCRDKTFEPNIDTSVKLLYSNSQYQKIWEEEDC